MISRMANETSEPINRKNDVQPRTGFATWRGAFMAALGLTLLYALTRLLFLERFPIFCDEATYVRWAQMGLENPALRFVSLTDGKQPLFPWLVMLAMQVVADPILAGRLVSVAAGWVAMIGTGCLAGTLFRDRRVGWFAAGLHVLWPFFLFHDRLALYESLTVAVMAWGLCLGVVLARAVRTDAALGLGLVAGTGALTKSSAFFTLAYLPLTLLVFPWRPFHLRRLLAWCGLALLATGLALLVFSILLTTPWFGMIAVKNHAFVYTLSEWVQAPFFLVDFNLEQLGPWLIWNVTPPLLLLALAGLLWGLKDVTARLLLLAAFAMPFCYLVCVGKYLYPRYLVFLTVPLVVLAARAAVTLVAARRHRGWCRIGLVLLLVYPVYFDLTIVAWPRHAPLVAKDRWQYIEDHPSGTGGRELMHWLRREAEKQPILVTTESEAGLYPACLFLYFLHHPRMEIRGVRDVTAPDTWTEVAQRAGNRPAYVVLWRAETQDQARGWPLALVWEYPRGAPGSFLRLYRVNP